MDVTQLALPWVHGSGGKKVKACVDLRANVISTKVSKSQGKFAVGVYLGARLWGLKRQEDILNFILLFFRDKAAERSYLLMNLSTINSRQKLPDNCKVMFRCLRSGWDTFRYLKFLTFTLFRFRSDPITVITGNFPAWVEELPRKW